eukprot:TRINITY_DN1304_c0_g2_i3.p1 TRINITY_DN1304_c0_g2~~TRINITY_DN1304_c0_g2_i3.p1  ORF type:complete len:855 (+),score=88.54 TRINITY_DN1304_c0_g2_i3:66-2630(+)
MCIRDSIKMISNFDIVAGDILELKDGDIIPVDGILIRGQTLQVDESSLTGESDVQFKIPYHSGNLKQNHTPFLLSSAKIIEGHGEMLVCSVGKESKLGQLADALEGESSQTALQDKLEDLSIKSALYGFYASILIFLVMTLHLFLDAYKDDTFWKLENFNQLIQNTLTALTLIAIAVQEGLPVAVSISFAYSVQKMKQENYLVRKMASCEAMGGVNLICTDKTGTLTTGRMTLHKIFVDDALITTAQIKDTLKPDQFSKLFHGICYNTSSTVYTAENGQIEHIGNKTDCALLEAAMKCGLKLESFKDSPKIKRQIGFNSIRKYMATVVEIEPKLVRVFLKGAPDAILNHCSQIEKSKHNAKLGLQDEMKDVKNMIEQLSAESYRCIGFCYKDVQITKEADLEHLISANEDDLLKDMNFIGLAVIYDPPRAEARPSIEKCNQAGIDVIMVTGDSKQTAIGIGRECGIISDQDFQNSKSVLEGYELRSILGQTTSEANLGASEDTQASNIKNFEAIVDQIKIIARASPSDKFLLVKTLKQIGKVVAVTGDGNNDAPALKSADVGISMGIQGTEIAKEAADIVLLDDNFSSIVTAVKWGRNIFDNIRKFIQFQITITIGAIYIAFIGCCFIKESPINPIQLMWVNLIQDTLASLALATDPPSESLLKRQPYQKSESIITKEMWINIIIQSIYQCLVLGILLFLGPNFLNINSSIGSDQSIREGPQWTHYTILFNCYVLMQIGNQINARKLKIDELNVFKDFFNNVWFISIMVGELIIQFLIVQYGGKYLRLYPLTFQQHLFCLNFTIGSILFNYLVKLIISLKKLIEIKNLKLESQPLLTKKRELVQEINYQIRQLD